jgi:hypothetical protein
MPCANCHKRSGWGTVEGPITTPAVTGHVLFNPVTLGNEQMGLRTTGPGTRPAYNDASLARALRDGIDPTGRRLAPTMPRYDLGPSEMTALTDYLRTLGAAPAPGVTATTLHLATIVTPGVDPSCRAAVLAVLRAFVDAKNAGSRNEARRRDNGPWDMKSHYEVYRQWELHEWDLSGSPGEWPTQLAALYSRQPVFAVVGGIGDGDWEPIHAFCESAAIPCVLPQTPWPPPRRDGTGFYSIYYSPGLALEVESLAQFVGGSGGADRRSAVRQIARCGSAGERAMRQLAQRLGAGADARPCTDGTEAIGPDRWRALLSDAPSTVVAWVVGADLAGLDEAMSTPNVLDRIERIVVSATLAGDALRAVRPTLRAKLYLASPYVSPSEFDQHAMRSLIWLKSRGLASANREVAVNAFFAVSVVADALGTPRAIESRDYFVEQLEHMVGRSPLRSAYPAVSLGPGRRFASLGCAVLKLPRDADGVVSAVVPWTVPDLKQQ